MSLHEMMSESTDDLRNPTSIVAVPSQYVAVEEKFEKNEKSRFPRSEIPTDLIIKVEDINFYVHKLPLLSRSEYLSQLVLQSSNSNYSYDIKLHNFPGGTEIFEVILKFCYGFPVNLTSTNVAPLRCAAEFLQMTEEYEEGNLVSKTEAFLTFIVLSSWRDSITVLKSCEDLSPWAENLHIVRRCSDSIAFKITRRTSVCGGADDDEKWWFNDVSTLRTDHFARIVTMIRAKGLRPEILGECIMHYAEKWLPSMEEDEKGYGCGKNEMHMSIMSGRRDEGGIGQNKEQRRTVEVLLSILPPQKEVVSCKFLLWMLKMAIVFSATPALVSELETKIGMVLQEATVNNLLIPNYNNGAEGSPAYEEGPRHDLDVVQRIVEYYLIYEQQQPQQHEQISRKLDVGKLLDGYLAEVATDPNLSIIKFQALAESLPQKARTCHDGLYRAIDTYLKTHPTLREHDRRRLCNVMDSEKLSLDACTHAAQNDRLPLRTVMQVLFSEQVKMRDAMKEKEPMENEIKEEERGLSTKREIKNIILELEKIRLTISELQHDYSELQKDLKTINKPKNASGWSSGWKKFKNSALFHSKHNDFDSQVQPEQTPNLRKNGVRRRQSYS